MALLKKTATKKTPVKASTTTTKSKVSAAARPTSPARRFPLSEADRHNLIAELAYYRAERRNFTGGAAEQYADWIEAEKELNGRLK